MKIESTLLSCGLNEKQIQVYLATLELGSASVPRISQKAKLIRTTVYEVLEVLKKKGFVYNFSKKRINYYAAAEPERLVRLAQNKVDALKNILPELNARSNSSKDRPNVRFYQGLEEIKIVMQEILDEADRLYGWGGADELLEKLEDWHLQYFLDERIKRKILLQILLRDTPKARERQKIGVNQLREVRLISNDTKFMGLTYIWKNKIAMFSLLHDFVAVVIENQELADMNKAIFVNLWNKS
ncbi:MAG: helix-turn-helix domain-containing protein [Patescibacteria group bacterium]